MVDEKAKFIYVIALRGEDRRRESHNVRLRCARRLAMTIIVWRTGTRTNPRQPGGYSAAGREQIERDVFFHRGRKKI